MSSVDRSMMKRVLDKVPEGGITIGILRNKFSRVLCRGDFNAVLAKIEMEGFVELESVPFGRSGGRRTKLVKKVADMEHTGDMLDGGRHAMNTRFAASQKVTGRGRISWPWKDMSVGDSVFFEWGDVAKRAKGSASTYGLHVQKSFRTEKGKFGVTVWRTR